MCRLLCLVQGLARARYVCAGWCWRISFSRHPVHWTCTVSESRQQEIKVHAQERRTRRVGRVALSRQFLVVVVKDNYYSGSSLVMGLDHVPDLPHDLLPSKVLCLFILHHHLKYLQIRSQNSQCNLPDSPEAYGRITKQPFCTSASWNEASIYESRGVEDGYRSILR